MKNKVIMILDSHAEVFLRHARTIALELVNDGKRVTIVDAYKLGFPQWGVRSQRSFNHIFVDVEVEILRPKVNSPWRSKAFRSEINTISNYVVERHKGDSKGRRFSRLLLRQYIVRAIGRAQSLVKGLMIEDSETEMVILRNGRSPWQSEVRRLLRKHQDLKVSHYDFPFFFGRNFAYLAPHRIHDRVALQKEASQLTSTEVNLGICREWLSDHKKHMKNKWRFKDPGVGRKNVIFSSSTFEFSGMPDVWSIEHYEDQYEGFSKYLDEEDPSGSETIIRIHPNLCSAPWRLQLSDIQRVTWLKSKHPSLSVVWHWESADSYKLMFEASNVIVSISTIGLEAICLGKRVVAIGPTLYDALAMRQMDSWRETFEDISQSQYAVDQLLSYIRLLSRPSFEVLDGRKFLARAIESLSVAPLLSCYTLLLEMSNKSSARIGVGLSKLMALSNRL